MYSVKLSAVLRDDGTVWLNLGDSYCGSGGAGNQKSWKSDGGLKNILSKNTKRKLD
jgi:hypothetical protein